MQSRRSWRASAVVVGALMASHGGMATLVSRYDNEYAWIFRSFLVAVPVMALLLLGVATVHLSSTRRFFRDAIEVGAVGLLGTSITLGLFPVIAARFTYGRGGESGFLPVFVFVVPAFALAVSALITVSFRLSRLDWTAR